MWKSLVNKKKCSRGKTNNINCTKKMFRIIRIYDHDHGRGIFKNKCEIHKLVHSCKVRRIRFRRNSEDRVPQLLRILTEIPTENPWMLSLWGQKGCGRSSILSTRHDFQCIVTMFTIEHVCLLRFASYTISILQLYVQLFGFLLILLYVLHLKVHEVQLPSTVSCLQLAKPHNWFDDCRSTPS